MAPTAIPHPRHSPDPAPNGDLPTGTEGSDSAENFRAPGGDDVVLASLGADAVTGAGAADAFVGGCQLDADGTPLMPEDQAAVTVSDFTPAEEGLEIGSLAPVTTGYTLTATADIADCAWAIRLRDKHAGTWLFRCPNPPQWPRMQHTRPRVPRNRGLSFVAGPVSW